MEHYLKICQVRIYIVRVASLHKVLLSLREISPKDLVPHTGEIKMGELSFKWTGLIAIYGFDIVTVFAYNLI